MTKKKLTDRQRVRRRYPTAKAARLLDSGRCWFVDKDDYSPALGCGSTAKEAWADAAKRLKQPRGDWGSR